MKKTDEENIKSVLREYIPEKAVNMAYDLMENHKIQFKITKARKTKLGDYRHATATKGHRITVNYDLNPYSFLITYIHEVAHLLAWERYKNQINPHGNEWKLIYGKLLNEFLALKCFPPELEHTLIKHINKPSASSCADTDLLRALYKYDKNYKNQILLEQLSENQLFKTTNNTIYKKGKKRRTRYICLNMNNKKEYLVHGLSQVELVDFKEN